MKNNKFRLIVILICVVIITIVSGFIFVNYQKQRPVEYLTEKYSANVDDFEFVDFKIRHFFIDMDRIKGGWQRSKWHYKYNDVIFTIEYDDEKKVYVDDYQLEEVFEWSVEYLQKNIDERIVGVDLDSSYFYYDPLFEVKKKETFNNRLIKKDEIFDFLENGFLEGLDLYYYEDDLNEDEFKRKITIKVNNHFNINTKIHFYKVDMKEYYRLNKNHYSSPDYISMNDYNNWWKYEK